MATELLIRFVVGGLVVVAFSLVGEIVGPRSLAGVFGGAPSVALATIALTFATKSGSVVSIEGRSMIVGAIALMVYSLLVGVLLIRRRGDAMVVGPLAWLVWLAVALGLWRMILA